MIVTDRSFFFQNSIDPFLWNGFSPVLHNEVKIRLMHIHTAGFYELHRYVYWCFSIFDLGHNLIHFLYCWSVIHWGIHL